MFKRPDKVRLDVETPRPATVLVDGRDISIPGMTESDKQQIGMTPMAQLFSELGAMFGGSPAALERHFDVVGQSSGNAIVVSLTPKLADWQRLFRRIQLTFTEPSLLLGAMQLDDPLGDRLEIVMSDVQRNIDLPDSTFRLSPTPR
jgi:outer membrane lipoprotein-sorting protein